MCEHLTHVAMHYNVLCIGALFLVYCKWALHFFSPTVMTVNSNSLCNLSVFYKCDSNCETREKQFDTVPCHLRLQRPVEMWWHTCRFRLSAKQTSPFKSVGGRQFSRLLSTEMCASAVVMLDTPCSEVVWRVLATHFIHQFPFHFSSRASLCAITFQLESTTMLGFGYGFYFLPSTRITFCLDVAYPNSFIHLPTGRGFLSAVTQTLGRIWLTQSVSVHTNHTTSLIQGDRKVAQPEVWHVLLARNECDEVELVDEYVGVTVQKLCSGKEQVTGPDAISAVALKPCLHQHFFFKKCSLLLLLNTIFKLDPIWFYIKFGLRNFSITLYNDGIITSLFYWKETMTTTTTTTTGFFELLRQ